MKLDENLSSIHSYLCADGYVIKNPKDQKHKYYRIGLRNTSLVLLKDFQNKFFKVFGVAPRLILGERCEIGSKEIYEKLSKKFGSFYSLEWKMPKEEERCKKFVKELLNEKIRIKKPYYARIISKNENNLKELNRLLKYFYGVEGRINKCINGCGSIYFELNINKKGDIEKLISNKIIENILK